MTCHRSMLGVGAALVILLIGCARVVAPVPPGPTTEPRVSWVIRSGPQGGEDTEVCRSDQQQTCVLQASTPARPRTVVVSVYLYAAGAPTKYSGAFLSGFMETATRAGYETKVDYAIDPARRPTATTVSGRITSMPGAYALRIALLAEVPMHMDPHQFELTVPVGVTSVTEE